MERVPLPKFSFQLTPSRRATRSAVHIVHVDDISTHALTEGDFCNTDGVCCGNISTHALTEGDFFICRLLLSHIHFNSRPHGGRRQI